MENQKSLANDSGIICHYHFTNKMTSCDINERNCHIVLAASGFQLRFGKWECTAHSFFSFCVRESAFFLLLCLFSFSYHFPLADTKTRLHKLTWTLFFPISLLYSVCYLYAAFCNSFRLNMFLFLSHFSSLTRCFFFSHPSFALVRYFFFSCEICSTSMFFEYFKEMCMNRHRWYYSFLCQKWTKMWNKCKKWSILNAHQFIRLQIKWLTYEVCNDDDDGALKIEIQQKSSEKFSEVAKA